MTVERAAPAKINLTLHVTGKRGDGYHLIDSLVTFGAVGDVVRVAPASLSSLTVTGPFADDVPRGPENLVLRAADAMGVTAAIALDKRLPVAAGLGGGSADAAATLLALAEMSGVPVPDDAALVALGADVPVCLQGGLVRMRGIGERLHPIGPRLDRAMILVNPGVALPTADVFEALKTPDNSPMPELLPDSARPTFSDFLAECRNDLEAAAMAIAPAIGAVLAALRALPGCRIARMSGSGATCFAIFEDPAAAARGAVAIGQDHPGWWVAMA